MGAHARLGPSNHRWPNCPGSVREESQYVDVAGDAAIDGTGSHLLLELCLQNGVRAEQYDMQRIGVGDAENPHGWLVDKERCERVQMCLDYITRRVGELYTRFPDATVTVEAETRSDPGGAFGRDDWWGTVDITIEVLFGEECLFLEVVDYKDGRGWVAEKDNSQLQAYLFGKMRRYVASGPDLVRPLVATRIVHGGRMTIVQPKTNPVVRYQDVTTQDVIEVAEKLEWAAELTDREDAPLVSGKHCQWCKANQKRGGHCTAAIEKGLQKVESVTNTTELTASTSLFEQVNSMAVDIQSLTPQQLSEVLDVRDAFNALFKRFEDEAENRIVEQCVQVPGYAMRPGRSSRVWSEDEETVVKKLKAKRLKNADIYPPKLISVTQVMKLESLSDTQRAKIEDELVATVEGKLKLTKVAHDDPVENKADELFAGVAQSATTELELVATETEATPVVSFL